MATPDNGADDPQTSYTPTAAPAAPAATENEIEESTPRLTLRLLRGLVGEIDLETHERNFVEDRKRTLEDAFYSEAIYVLVRKWITPAHARNLWNSLLAHRDDMAQKIGRNPGLHVASLDYLENVEKDSWRIGLVEMAALDFLLHDTTRDAVTQLFDRESFLANLEREIDRARRYHRHLAVDILDMDNLGSTNEKQGRVFGDYVLREMAAILEKMLRSSDFPCRYGGGQFALLLPESNVQRAFLTAERVRRRVEKNPFQMRGGQQPLHLTISAGVAEYPIHGRDPGTLLESAESALRLAKETGKNKVCLPPRVVLGTT
jgi:diguanylate cyclase (GGDEF)-like protein